MDELTFLTLCKNLAGDTSDSSWTPDHMAGFFQVFRPDGRGLESLFVDIPAGAEVYNRLRKIYRATVAGSQGPQGMDAYFIVRNPEPTTVVTLTRYATAQMTNWRSMAAEVHQQELVDLLTPLPRIQITTDQPPAVDPRDYDSLDTFIYDVQTDWHCQLEPLCPHARWMREAFYYINCDYCLARHVTWPWYRNSSSINEPFEPYFGLWLHGAILRCQAPENVKLFVNAA